MIDGTCFRNKLKKRKRVSISENERNTLVQEAGESIQKKSAKRLDEMQIIWRVKEEEIQRLKDSVVGV